MFLTQYTPSLAVVVTAEFVVEWLVCSTLLLVLAFVLNRLLHRSSAAIRHRVWMLTFCGLLVLPMALAFLPALHLPLLPAETVEANVALAINDRLNPDDRSTNAPAIDLDSSNIEGTINGPVGDVVHELAKNEEAESAITATTIAPVSETKSSSPWWRIGITIVWLLGVVVSLVPFVRGWVSSQLLRANAEPVDDANVRTLVTEVCQKLNLQGHVALFQNSKLNVPLTWGTWRPIVCVPSDCDRWSDVDWRVVLTHELAHVKRRDVLTQTVARFACAIHWFHPMTWYAMRKFRMERELACDDCVVGTGQKPSEYARQLVQIARRCQPRETGYAVAMAGASKLETRVDSMLNFAISHLPVSRQASRWLAVAALSTLFAVSTVRIGRQTFVPPTESGDSIVAAQDSGKQDAGEKMYTFAGQFTDSDGKPVADVDVVLLGSSVKPRQAGDLRSSRTAMFETRSNESGQYNFQLNIDSTQFHSPALVARKAGFGLAISQVNLNQTEATIDLKLEPEMMIRGRMIDIDGQPAKNISFAITAVMEADPLGETGQLGYLGQRGTFFHGQDRPEVWPADVTTDDEGSFAIPSISEGYGVFIEVPGDERFAPQSISLNTGAPETRGPRDATFRSLTKNAKPGEEVTLTLGSAQWFEGTVTYADTGKPAPHTKLSIWASQQETLGSMVLAPGQADENGKFRLNPPNGVRFGITAYPAEGAPYLSTAIEDLTWDAGDRTQKVDIKLPRGVLVTGKIQDAETGEPIPDATVQYQAERLNNEFYVESMVTGWQAMRLSNANGEFSIAVIPGPGRILVKTPGNYVLKTLGSRMVYRSQPGGSALQINAVKKIDPKEGSDAIDLGTLPIEPGGTVHGKLLDENEQPLDGVTVISWLTKTQRDLNWRALTSQQADKTFTLEGLATNRKYSAYALHPEKKLGGAVELITGDTPTVQLKPCGQATACFVDAEGKPMANFNPFINMLIYPGEDLDTNEANQELSPNEAFLGYLDRVNHTGGRETDEDGQISWGVLIPGAKYRLGAVAGGELLRLKDFTVKSGEELDLGTYRVNENAEGKLIELVEDTDQTP